MLFTIQVNNKKIRAEKGETILSALNRNGIIIPTLCRMKDFTPTGACRMCVVEVEGRDRLVAACSQPVEEWMKIRTHSPRVITARKTNVELLLSNHPDDCLYCDRNLNCELQRLAEELNIRERRIKAKKIRPMLDQSSPSIVRELSKCILCGRCVRVCEEVVTATSIDFIYRGSRIHVGPAMDRDFNFSSCINCGQCITVCPTGALHEKYNISEVQEYLNNPEFLKVIQYSPVVPAGIAEESGIKYNRDFDRILNSVLRKIGFEKVYNTGTGTDILIWEMAEQLRDRIRSGLKEPLFISACPAWNKYAEQFLPSYLPMLSSLKCPQQIAGSLVRTAIADQAGVKPEKIFSVSVTPCTAMKFEARRDGMMRRGISDIDSVLTVRELGRLIRLYGIDLNNSGSEQADSPMEGFSSAASLAELSGGLAEGIIRTLCYSETRQSPARQYMKKLRAGASFRETVIPAGRYEVSVAIVDGLTGLEKLQSSLDAGNKYDLVEVMVCPGGCINGAGMPFRNQKDDRKNLARMIYQADEHDAIDLPENSPVMMNFYDKLIAENNEIADKKIFHTHYVKRNVLL